jgi:hypothetical protein
MIHRSGDDGEHLVLLHQLADDLDGPGRVVVIILRLEDDLAAADAPFLRIDVLEVGFGAREDGSERCPVGATLGEVAAQHYLCVGDAGNLASGRGLGHGSGRCAGGGSLLFLILAGHCHHKQQRRQGNEDQQEFA